MNQADASRSYETSISRAAFVLESGRKIRALIRTEEGEYELGKVHRQRHPCKISCLLESRILLDDLPHAPLVRRPVLLE